MTEKIRVGGADFSLRRREFEVVLPQLLEQLLNVEDVSGGIRIEDDVIEVGGHVGKAFHDFVDHRDEPSRCRAAPLSLWIVIW